PCSRKNDEDLKPLERAGHLTKRCESVGTLQRETSQEQTNSDETEREKKWPPPRRPECVTTMVSRPGAHDRELRIRGLTPVLVLRDADALLVRDRARDPLDCFCPA